VTNDTPARCACSVRPPRSPRRGAPNTRRAFRSRREIRPAPSAAGRW
jgi:hypothetical protein